MEGTARQPEAGGAIRTTAIILAALIEGFTFLAIIFVYILGGKAIEAGGTPAVKQGPPPVTTDRKE
jgi:hypothetical protein